MDNAVEDCITRSRRQGNILDRMLEAYVSKPEPVLSPNQVSRENMVKLFNDFTHKFNCKIKGLECKLETDLDTGYLSKVISIDISGINVNFLAPSFKDVPMILHAIHTFSLMFKLPKGLVMYICLDENQRTFDAIPDQKLDLETKMKILKQNSRVFSTSGVTYPFKKTIYLTKREEMVKLLFHELVHYAKLDNVFFDYPIKTKWGIKDKDLNISESYTEFVSILLHSAYYAIAECSRDDSKYDDLVLRYHQIVKDEISYSVELSANLLKYCLFNESTYMQFFNGESVISFPIQITEYIFIRTVLMIHLDKVLEIVGPSLYVKKKQVNSIYEIISGDDSLSKLIGPEMKTVPSNDLSYIKYDVLLL